MTIRPTIIARTITRTVVPIIFLTSIALVLQGHNLPGGGFIGGALTVTAFALIYIIYGADYLSQALLSSSASSDESGAVGPSNYFSGAIGIYTLMFGIGLTLAVGEGLVAIALGVPFLSQAVVFVHHVPIYGELEFASALEFDLGVYFVVVGALLTILGGVGEE